MKGACVSVELILPLTAWPLLAWAVSNSTEWVDMDPLKMNGADA